MVWTKEGRAIYNKKYYQEHKEEIAIRVKKYRREHKELRTLQINKYRQKYRDEIAVYQKNYRQKHKEERAVYNKNWEQEHKEKIAKRKKKYSKEHKNETAMYTKKYMKKYRQGHPDIVRRGLHKHKLKKRQLNQMYTPRQWSDKVDATNGICPQCGRIYDDVYPFCVTMDHVPSISIAPVGFSYTINNVFPRCGSCNSSNHVHSNDNTSLENFGL